MTTWPTWWDWELELTPHLFKRMEDRDFTELDVRAMLQMAEGFRLDVVEERFVIETRFRTRPWEVIVEPDALAQLLIVITAYQLDTP